MYFPIKNQAIRLILEVAFSATVEKFILSCFTDFQSSIIHLLQIAQREGCATNEMLLIFTMLLANIWTVIPPSLYGTQLLIVKSKKNKNKNNLFFFIKNFLSLPLVTEIPVRTPEATEIIKPVSNIISSNFDGLYRRSVWNCL